MWVSHVIPDVVTPADRALASATLAWPQGPEVGYEHTQEEVLPCFVPTFLKFMLIR